MRAIPIGRSASSRRCARWTRTKRRSRSYASWPTPMARAATGPRRSRTRRRSSTRTRWRRAWGARGGQTRRAAEHERGGGGGWWGGGAGGRHGDAEQKEQQKRGHTDVERWAGGAEACASSLKSSPADMDAMEVHYLLGDIYFFK